MGNKDVSSAKPATTAAAPVEAATPVAAAGVGTAMQEKAEAANKEATGKGKLYKVASPITHDDEDYAAGDEIRLPEATAARLAGYLEA